MPYITNPKRQYVIILKVHKGVWDTYCLKVNIEWEAQEWFLTASVMSVVMTSGHEVFVVVSSLRENMKINKVVRVISAVIVTADKQFRLAGIRWDVIWCKDVCAVIPRLKSSERMKRDQCSLPSVLVDPLGHERTMGAWVVGEGRSP